MKGLLNPSALLFSLGLAVGGGATLPSLVRAAFQRGSAPDVGVD